LHVLVTGGTGFIGHALCRALAESGNAPRVALRHQTPAARGSTCLSVAVGEINGSTEWTNALRNINCVIHLAARTHVLRETVSDTLSAYRRVNVDGTRRLAEQAAAAGVRRLVFLSSVKVNAERTTDHPCTERDIPRPEDAYGMTKWEAEQALRQIEQATGLEVVILRPPLVYGPGVKGNFLRLMKLVARGLPVPFASVRNQRSMIYIGDLVDAILACVRAPAAAGQTYLVSDGTDISTPELVSSIGRAMGVSPRLFPFPPSLLMAAATIIGKRNEARRLLGSLQVDSSRIRRELEWQPPYTMEQGLAETARWFLEAVNRKS